MWGLTKSAFGAILLFHFCSCSKANPSLAMIAMFFSRLHFSIGRMFSSGAFLRTCRLSPGNQDVCSMRANGF